MNRGDGLLIHIHVFFIKIVGVDFEQITTRKLYLIYSVLCYNTLLQLYKICQKYI